MNSLICCYILVLCVTHASSVTISTPDMQRKTIGESCTFQWDVTGIVTNYTIKILSTGTPAPLSPNANHTFNSRKGVITLFIWNIQTSNAGNYSLSISTGTSMEVNSAALLFVYAAPNCNIILAVGVSPIFEGEKIELNCSFYSYSLPAAYRTKMYYFWYNSVYGYLRNISNGPAVLQNGDVLPGYSIKNDGKTFVIASAQNIDSSFYCSVQEEGSPYIRGNYLYGLKIYSKPYIYSLTPASRRLNIRPLNGGFLSFNFRADPPLISYTNWSFVNASGSTTEYSVGSIPLASSQVYLSFTLSSANLYGNYSVSLTNSNGTKTETFQVLPPGPPDSPSNFSVQYVTQSLVSLQWRCMWDNGVQQTVFVRLMDIANNEEIETQAATLATNCYNSAYSTVFKSNIQPETEYRASIWSVNTLGSSKVITLAVRTSRRLIFDTSSADISIMKSQATISFRIADSTKAILWLNVTCCVEITALCSNNSYMIANTDNQIVYDILPTGNEYVFDFIVYDTDGYTYVYTLAIVKGVRVSRTDDPTKYNACDMSSEKEASLRNAVIVLAILLGIAVLALIGCLIGFLAFKCRRERPQQSLEARHRIQSPQSLEARHRIQSPESRKEETSIDQEDNYEPMNMDSAKDDNIYTQLD